MNILYVENHSIFAENVRRQFLSQHHVVMASSLKAARVELQKEKFDFLLVDYDLDDGKGDELVRSLRDSDDQTKIVAVSSHDEGNAALLKAGANDVCDKMNFDQIQLVIERVQQTSHKI